MELIAPVRILDQWRLVLVGANIQRVYAPLTKFIQLPSLGAWSLKFPFWARDISIRRNMTTSIWVNISKIISSKEVAVTTGEPVPQEGVLAASPPFPLFRVNSLMAIVQGPTVMPVLDVSLPKLLSFNDNIEVNAMEKVKLTFARKSVVEAWKGALMSKFDMPSCDF